MTRERERLLQAVAQSVLRAAARVSTTAAQRSAAQAEIALAEQAPRGRPVELRLTAEEAARVAVLQVAPEFCLERVLDKGRVWRPRDTAWAETYARRW